MSTHPNAMLVLVLTPDDLARKTYREIMAEAGIDDDHGLKLGDEYFGQEYMHKVMEDDYDGPDGFQIVAKAGSIVFFTYLTYGYGKRMPWEKAQACRDLLAKWAEGVCERHHCTAEISIGANYW